MQNQFLAQCIASANQANSQAQYAAAVSLCQQAIRFMPKFPEAWYNLGIAYRGLGQHEQSLEAFKQAAGLARGNADAQNSIGFQFLQMGALREAEQCLKRALSLVPRFAYAHSNLGMLYEKKGCLAEAESSFRRAIEIQSDLAPAYVNLGGVLNRRKAFAEAAEVIEKSIEIDPAVSEAWNNLGAALTGLKRYDLAVEAARKSIEIDPLSVASWKNLGDALSNKNRYKEAIDCFLESLRLESRETPVLVSESVGNMREPAPGAGRDSIFGSLFGARMAICDWIGYAENLKILIRQIEIGEADFSPFWILAVIDDLAKQRQFLACYVEDELPARGDLGAVKKTPSREKVRIGYYSADFHNHATMYLMAELFELHDKTRFELIGFSFGPDVQDEMRGRASTAFDRFIDVRDRSDKEVAQLSREMGIDIAVDLKGYTKDSRPGIFAFRAAPIQVNYLGYPATMAAEFIDYIVADRVLIPEESQALYAEKIVYLPDSYQVNDARRQISARAFTREAEGLPATGFVFACFNNNYKITPPVFDGWMRILKQVPDSVLWLFETTPEVVANLRKEAVARDVAPERLVFALQMPLSEHLARIRLADLFLDTFPYNAHTTTSDALWVGLPVLTCMGESFASRVAASLLSAMGLPELITVSQAAYEGAAIALASDPLSLGAIRQKLVRNRDTQPLFDSRRFARYLEAAYRTMYERYQADVPPDHIYIEPDSSL